MLAEELPDLQNIHVSAIEQNGKVVFLHKIKEGAADKSYGIHVAQLAELPAELIDRANEILEKLEKKEGEPVQKPVREKVAAGMPELTAADPAPAPEVHDAQLSFFDGPAEPKKASLSPAEKKILDKLAKMDILEMTPLDAMNTLYELQKTAKSTKK
ncbi:DNA mismatch repair protein mutS [Mycobacteroides abscessus subsp. abscessus]|nr:DNA mismatch repair protein mutS [Mycobacteroides abscessus subsp. abscessus]